MKRGEIRWYRFKKPDKKRPILILTRSAALEYLHEITVAPLTTTIRDIPTEILLTKNDGLPQECCIKCGPHPDSIKKQNRFPHSNANGTEINAGP